MSRDVFASQECARARILRHTYISVGVHVRESDHGVRVAVRLICAVQSYRATNSDLGARRRIDCDGGFNGLAQHGSGTLRPRGSGVAVTQTIWRGWISWNYGVMA